MESTKDVGANRARRTDAMAPLTWDPDSGPAPGLEPEPADGTEQTPTFETADLEGFGDSEGERTVIQAATPYDLRPKFTGRAAALQQLQAMTDKAFAEKQIAFAVVVGEPGMGKSRIVSE